jgi:ketosteroid isomerase-like protein
MAISTEIRGIIGNTNERFMGAFKKGDTAVEVGRYTLSGEGGQVLDTGKYVVIWKKEDDAWRYHRDIWNSSMPLPGQG